MSSKIKENLKRITTDRNHLILIGFLVIVFAISIPMSTFSPVIKSEINYQLNQKKSVAAKVNPVDPEFSVVIPKINANTKVIKNVDPFDSKIYQFALTRGVAHANTSSLPDESGNVFLFAHSAGNWYQANQFNAVFYLLNKLEAKDKIILFYQSHPYVYVVEDKKFIKASEVNYLSSVSPVNQLTLMTCWPPGTTLKRLVVVATLTNDTY